MSSLVRASVMGGLVVATLAALWATRASRPLTVDLEVGSQRLSLRCLAGCEPSTMAWTRALGDRVEHGLTFVEPPARSGPLRVTLQVDGAQVVTHGDGVRLESPSGSLTYEFALWRDADGHEHEVQVRAERGALLLEVPEAVWANSRYPAVLDPVVGVVQSTDAPVLVPAGNAMGAVVQDGLLRTLVLSTFWPKRSNVQTMAPDGGLVAGPTGVTIDGEWYRLAGAVDGGLIIGNTYGQFARVDVQTGALATIPTGGLSLGSPVAVFDASDGGTRVIGTGSGRIPDGGFGLILNVVELNSEGYPLGASQFLGEGDGWCLARTGSHRYLAARDSVDPARLNVWDVLEAPLRLVLAATSPISTTANNRFDCAGDNGGALFAFGTDFTPVTIMYLPEAGAPQFALQSFMAGSGGTSIALVALPSGGFEAMMLRNGELILTDVSSTGMIGLSARGPLGSPGALGIADGVFWDGDLVLILVRFGRQAFALRTSSLNGPQGWLNYETNAQQQPTGAFNEGKWGITWGDNRAIAESLAWTQVRNGNGTAANAPREVVPDAGSSAVLGTPAICAVGRGFVAVHTPGVSPTVYRRYDRFGVELDPAPQTYAGPGYQAACVEGGGNALLVDREYPSFDLRLALISEVALLAGPVTIPGIPLSGPGALCSKWAFDGVQFVAMTCGSLATDRHLLRLDASTLQLREPGGLLMPPASTLRGTLSSGTVITYPSGSDTLFAVVDPAGSQRPLGRVLGGEVPNIGSFARARDGLVMLGLLAPPDGGAFTMRWFRQRLDGGSQWFDLGFSGFFPEVVDLISDGDGGYLAVGSPIEPDSGVARLELRVLSEAELGTSCAADFDCESGFCVDGVCCDQSCGGTASSDCQACSVAAGASIDGRCVLLPGTVVCRAGVGLCDVADMCSGASPLCPMDQHATDGTPCPPGVCLGGRCALGGGDGGFDGGDDAGLDAGDDAGTVDGGASDAGDDAGVVDAGVTDGGVTDAGMTDAGFVIDGGSEGVDAGDEPGSSRRLAVGCGCDTTSGLGWSLVLILCGRIRRRV